MMEGRSTANCGRGMNAYKIKREDRKREPIYTMVNTGTRGHTPKPTSKDSHHSICNTVSFSEENMKTDIVAAKAREFTPTCMPAVNQTSRKATTLQRGT